ncbi:MAG: NAD(P)H-dependent oxidoreductase [Syntrophaceae bacterium]|nr:NAD(P)H-dependent oxidoreductase [Syntrophaceae bacterium]
MNRILILFAHPRYEKSRVNRALLDKVKDMPEVTVHDLYERYPDFNIHSAAEQKLLREHEIIIWHHPFYMYGAPAMLKQWIDLVLEYGWAHGQGGEKLKGKIIFNTLTSGGTREVYSAAGFNRFTIGEFLLPFNQTATLCGMIYLPPFAVQGTYLLKEEELREYADLYRTLLNRLIRGEYQVETIRRFFYLNDWLQHEKGAKKS